MAALNCGKVMLGAVMRRQVGNGYNLQHMPLSNSRPLADPHQGPSFLGRPRAFPVPNEHAVRP